MCLENKPGSVSRRSCLRGCASPRGCGGPHVTRVAPGRPRLRTHSSGVSAAAVQSRGAGMCTGRRERQSPRASVEHGPQASGGSSCALESTRSHQSEPAAGRVPASRIEYVRPRAECLHPSVHALKPWPLMGGGGGGPQGGPGVPPPPLPCHMRVQQGALPLGPDTFAP